MFIISYQSSVSKKCLNVQLRANFDTTRCVTNVCSIQIKLANSTTQAQIQCTPPPLSAGRVEPPPKF